MKSVLCLLVLSSAVAPAMKAAAIETAASVNVLVTDRTGKPLSSAHVVVKGVSARAGDTNAVGRVVFTNMKAGDYVLRVEHDKFITFEKDFAVRGESGAIPVVAAVSPNASLPARSSKALSSSAQPAQTR